MAILISFLQYALKFVILVAVAGAGIFLGKNLRDRKDAKAAAEERTQEDK